MGESKHVEMSSTHCTDLAKAGVRTSNFSLKGVERDHDGSLAVGLVTEEQQCGHRDPEEHVVGERAGRGQLLLPRRCVHRGRRR